MIFDIRNYGAVGNGEQFNTSAIQKAIDDCNSSGGGRVLVAGGVYKTSTFFLKSNVELHIAADGVLLGPSECEDYPEIENVKHIDTSEHVFPRHRSACLIYCEESENVSITGMGKIDGNGSCFVTENPLAPEDPKGMHIHKIRLNNRTPAFVVVFAGCKNIKVEGITMCNQPPAWFCWVHDCDYVSFDKCNIIASPDYPNSDGIHINSSRNVTVSNCNICCGDDALVVRACNITLKENKVCEKVTVVNCNLSSTANAIRIGWTNDGVIKNCVFSNLTMTDSRNGICIHLPGRDEEPKFRDEGREATAIENLSFNNIVMDGIYGHPVRILISEGKYTLCNYIKNIDFSNIRADSLDDIFIMGRKDNSVKNITFSGCTFNKFLSNTDAKFKYNKAAQIQRPEGVSNIMYAENIQFRDTTVAIV